MKWRVELIRGDRLVIVADEAQFSHTGVEFLADGKTVFAVGPGKWDTVFALDDNGDPAAVYDWETPNSSTATRLQRDGRPAIPAGTRYRILRRDGFECKLCGANRDGGAKLHVDHIFAYSLGGPDTDDNLRTLCAECNQGKGAKE